MGGHRGPADVQARSNMKSMKGQLGTRSSALSPTSSKLTTQYLVLDHMNNHYKKIVNAKPAIDNRIPKSVSSSQKVRDKQTKDYVKKTGSRPTSRVSIRPQSQTMMYTDQEDMYDEDVLDDYDPEDEDDKMVLDIMRTTLKSNRNGKMGSTDATYGGSEAISVDIHKAHSKPLMATERYQYDTHANASAYTRRPASARSVRSTSSMSRSKLPQGQQKGHGTYDGDVLDKRSHVFTEPEKPFTPRTLKSTRSSKLSQYKFYTPPPQKRKEELKQRKMMEDTQSNQKGSAPIPKPRPRPRTTESNSNLKTDTDLSETTLMFETLQTRDFDKYGDKEQLVPPLDISMDKDHMNWIKEQASKAEIRAKSSSLKSSMSKIKEDELMNTTGEFRNTADLSTTSETLGKTTRSFGTGSMSKSQRLGNQALYRSRSRLAFAEEELKYVEFTREVTEDVLNRGVFTNRVLQQVFDSHIAKNRGALDERKMRAVLNQVRNDLGVVDDSGSTYESSKGSPIHDSTVSSHSSKFRLTPGYNPQDTSQFGSARLYDKTFSSTMDSQNTFGMLTSEGDMFSTIHSEPEGLSDTLALQSYQMNITRKEEIEERDEEEGEVKVEDEEEGEIEEGQVSDYSQHIAVSPVPQVTHQVQIHRDGDSESVRSSASRSTATRTEPQPRQIMVGSSLGQHIAVSPVPQVTHQVQIHRDGDSESVRSSASRSTVTRTEPQPRQIMVGSSFGPPSPKPRSVASQGYETDDTLTTKNAAMSEAGTEGGADGEDEYESDEDMLVTGTHRTSDDDF